MFLSLEQNELSFKSILQRIANILLINGGFSDNPGLYTGEMGLVLFFFRYARYTQNNLYREYAYDLMDKTQNRLHLDTPIYYKHGLAGIGSAIEYLVQKGFVEVDTDDILEDVDEHLLSLRNLPCVPLHELLSIGYYALWRITGSSALKDTLLKTFIPEMVRFMEEKSKHLDSTHPTVSYFKDLFSQETPFVSHDISDILLRIYPRCRNSPYRLESTMYSRLREYMDNNTDMAILSKHAGLSLQTGIQNGLAGLGLALLTELDGDDSWISLFPNEFSSTECESLK